MALRPGRMLLVNAGDEYESSVDAPATSCVSIFLPRESVAAAASAAASSPADSLDGAGPDRVPGVVSLPLRPSTVLSGRLSQLSSCVAQSRGDDMGLLEECVLEVVRGALAESLHVFRGAASLDDTRRTARLEVIRRVLRAREFIEDSAGGASLVQMADAACLSRFHFLRAFRQVFGVTPVRYARQLRIRRGLRVLSAGQSAASAAKVAGFGSASTFLRAARHAAR